MIGKIKLGYMAAQNYGKKHFATAVKSMKELKAKVKIPNKSSIKSFGSKVEKHIKRHPIKYTAGATAIATAGVYSKHQKLKKDGTHARLKKALKEKGYV
jgi:hypothetical protein